MRIGIDASNLDSGGSNTHLREILAAADPARDGFTRIVVWASPRVAASLPQTSAIEPVGVPMLGKSRLYRAAWQRELTKLSRASADILFTPGQIYLGSFRPFVTMSRNLLLFEPQEMRRYPIYSGVGARLALLKALQTYTFRRATGTIFLTETSKQIVEREIGVLKTRTAVVPHGVSEKFLAEPRPQRPIASYTADAPFTWIYISKVDVYKHHDKVAEAVALLRAEGLPVALDVVGPAYGPSMARFEAVVARVDPQRRFLRYSGAVPYDQLPARCQAADGAIFASSCENMPNSLVECMAAGLPVASSDRGVMPEVVADGAVLFDPENVASIAAALRRLVGDPDLRALVASRAYARARELSWQRCARDTFAFLREVALGIERASASDRP